MDICSSGIVFLLGVFQVTETVFDNGRGRASHLYCTKQNYLNALQKSEHNGVKSQRIVTFRFHLPSGGLSQSTLAVAVSGNPC